MRTKTLIGALIATSLLALASAAQAEATLYEQIGGEPVLRKTVEEFMIIMEATTASISRSAIPTPPSSSSCCSNSCATSLAGHARTPAAR